ncbi:hypothetical protein B6S12_08575, partial [Helicobacter valdiviensis]
ITTKNGLTLIGNKVDIQKGNLINTGTNKDKNQSIYLVGDKIYIDADATNLSGNTIYATAFSKGYIQRQMNKFAKDNYQFGNYDKLITNQGYTDSNNTTTQGKDFKKAITIGNMGSAIENAKEWWYFADGWNYDDEVLNKWGRGDIRDIDEFRLVGDIDFGGDKGKNYANFGIDLDGNGTIESHEYTNMIISHRIFNDKTDGFNKVFDGQGYTLSNINIDHEVNKGGTHSVGIFGMVSEGGILKNVNVDYKGGGVSASSIGNGIQGIGGFVGAAYGGTFENIKLYNLSKVSTDSTKFSVNGVGGFIGYIARNSQYIDIDVYLTPSAIIENTSNNPKSTKGKFFGIVDDDNVDNLILDNINVYYKKDTLGEATADQGYADKGITFIAYDEEPIVEIKDNNNGLTEVILDKSDYDSSIVTDIYNQIVGEEIVVDLEQLFIYDTETKRIVLNEKYLETIGKYYPQAVAFLEAFYSEEGLGDKFEEWYNLGIDDNIGKITQAKNDFLDFLNNNLQTKIKLFEEWKSNYELYTSGLATEEQMKNLESWFKNNGANLKAYQAFLDNPMLTDIGEHNFKLGDGSLSFVNGKGYKGLSTPIQQEGGSDQTITSPLKDINASMLDKQQVVLIKPAEEEKETLDEEKGVLNQRTCVVSENFKTNNPCMAQRI